MKKTSVIRMKKQKEITEQSKPGIEILEEMVEIEQEFQRKREEKKSELESVRQELIARLKKVDEYLGTNSFGMSSRDLKEKGKRLRKGELERYIKEALAQGAAPIGELLRRIHEAGLTDKDSSIRSKVGNPKWIQANGIVKNGGTFNMKK
jgi:hypothetical protein